MLRPLLFTALLIVSLLALAALGARAAQPVKGGDYFDNSASSQRRDAGIDFHVSRSGRFITEGEAFVVFVDCSNGRRMITAEAYFRRIPVREGGSFRGRSRQENPENEPFARSSTVFLRGGFRRAGKLARGRVRIRLVGERGTVCDSGLRPFRARLDRSHAHFAG